MSILKELRLIDDLYNHSYLFTIQTAWCTSAISTESKRGNAGYQRTAMEWPIWKRRRWQQWEESLAQRLQKILIDRWRLSRQMRSCGHSLYLESGLKKLGCDSTRWKLSAYVPSPAYYPSVVSHYFIRAEHCKTVFHFRKLRYGSWRHR